MHALYYVMLPVIYLLGCAASQLLMNSSTKMLSCSRTNPTPSPHLGKDRFLRQPTFAPPSILRREVRMRVAMFRRSIDDRSARCSAADVSHFHRLRSGVQDDCESPPTVVRGTPACLRRNSIIVLIADFGRPTFSKTSPGSQLTRERMSLLLTRPVHP